MMAIDRVFMFHLGRVSAASIAVRVTLDGSRMHPASARHAVQHGDFGEDEADD